MHHPFLILHQVEGHAGERPWKRIEVDGVVITRDEMVQHAVHINTLDITSCVLVGRFVEPDFMVEEIDALVFALI